MSDPLVSLLIGIVLLVLGIALFWPERGLVSRWRAVRQLTARVLQEDALKHIQKLDFSGQTSWEHCISLSWESMTHHH